MIGRLVLRVLAERPVRFLALSGGFGFGIAVMATLLGVGEVVLEQAKNPALSGGGDLVLTDGAGAIDNARFVLATLSTPPLAQTVATASPDVRETVYLVEPGGVTPLRARGGIPGLERALGDPEIASVPGWSDTATDRAWAHPDPADVLRRIDAFHPIPDVPTRAGSWAEWLYFNGRSRDGAIRLYLSFMAGPRSRGSLRSCVVLFKLTRGDATVEYTRTAEVEEDGLLGPLRTIAIAGNRVALEGLRYTIDLDLKAASGEALRGQITLDATPGKSMPPLTLRGAGGWESGYVVPVLSGKLDGKLRVGGQQLALDDAIGYHDHNWGFWTGVMWQWGQVAQGDLSIVFGRIRPPADAADAARVPGLLAVIGPEGALGVSRAVTIEEDNVPGGSQPKRIAVRASGPDMTLALDFDAEEALHTGLRERGGRIPTTFLQLRGTYHVHGTVGGREIDFRAPGSAETFRGESGDDSP